MFAVLDLRAHRNRKSTQTKADGPIRATDIEALLYEDKSLSPMALEAAADVVNTLLPFWQPVRDVEHSSVPFHVAAPWWRVTAAVLRAADRADLAPALAPCATSRLRAVPLNTLVQFEIFCFIQTAWLQRKHQQQQSLVQAIRAAGGTIGDQRPSRDTDGNAVWASIFDLQKIDRVCKRAGLVFDKR